MYVGSLKGLEERGTRGEGRQGKIGDEIILSRDHGNGNLAPVPFTESRRLWSWVRLVLNVHQTESHSTGFRVSSPEFSLNIYTDLSISKKSPLFKMFSS